MAVGESRRIAQTAGWSYLVIIVCGLFAEFGVRQPLLGGELDEQRARIIENPALFRAGIACDLVMLLADVVVAWALYVFFSRVDKNVSLLAAFFRLVQASVIGAGLIQLRQVLLVSNSYDVAKRIAEHSDGYLIGLVFFGACCLVTAWLALRSGEVPKLIGVLLGLAGIGYLADTFLNFLWVGHTPEITNVLLLPAFVGEIAFCVWLIGWGGKRSATSSIGQEVKG